MSRLMVAVTAGRRQYKTRTTGGALTCTGSCSTAIPGRSNPIPASRTEARAADVRALGGRAGFAEVGRMLREPREQERFRRGHLLLRRQ